MGLSGVMVPGAAASRHEAKDNLEANLQATAAAAARERFAGAYGDHHTAKDTHSGLGAGEGGGFVPDADRAAGEAFDGYYQGQHAGHATRSNVDQSRGGLTARRGAERPEDVATVYGSRHAHQVTRSNIEAGMVGARDAVSEGIFSDGRAMQHAGMDNVGGIGAGMLGRAGAVQREGFAAAYSDAHAHKDTESGFGVGMVAREDQSQREGFAAAYSDAHAGKDTETNFEPGGWVPRVQWKGGSAAKMAYERRKALNDYYAAAAAAGGGGGAGEGLRYEPQRRDTAGLAAGLSKVQRTTGGERPF